MIRAETSLLTVSSGKLPTKHCRIKAKNFPQTRDFYILMKITFQHFTKNYFDKCSYTISMFLEKKRTISTIYPALCGLI